MAKWNETKPGGQSLKEEWKATLSTALQDLNVTDKTEKVQKALEIALGIAENILGVSKPKRASHIPFHSSEAKRLLSLRRDARAAIVDLRTRIMSCSTSSMNMSRALRKAWDRH